MQRRESGSGGEASVEMAMVGRSSGWHMAEPIHAVVGRGATGAIISGEFQRPMPPAAATRRPHDSGGNWPWAEDVIDRRTALMDDGQLFAVHHDQLVAIIFVPGHTWSKYYRESTCLAAVEEVTSMACSPALPSSGLGCTRAEYAVVANDDLHSSSFHAIRITEITNRGTETHAGA